MAKTNEQIGAVHFERDLRIYRDQWNRDKGKIPYQKTIPAGYELTAKKIDNSPYDLRYVLDVAAAQRRHDIFVYDYNARGNEVNVYVKNGMARTYSALGEGAARRGYGFFEQVLANDMAPQQLRRDHPSNAWLRNQGNKAVRELFGPNWLESGIMTNLVVRTLRGKLNVDRSRLIYPAYGELASAGFRPLEPGRIMGIGKIMVKGIL